MCRAGNKKYHTVQRPLTLAETRYHLSGGLARGGLCSYANGQARGLCWDTDTAEGWQRFTEAAQALTEAGYLPVLEPSPAARGGHLWIIFDDLIDAGAARTHIYEIAPMLAAVSEYWPGPANAKHWNKVRLPGGKYVRPQVNAWCRLISVADGETTQDGGLQAARLLLAHQTPAAVVPVLPQEALPMQAEASTLAPEPPDQPISPSRGQRVELDPTWHANYDTPQGKRLWFAFPETYVAAWWNERHPLDELLPSERNGYGLATWRGESEGSVAKRGDRWADFGQSARRPDGNPDTGDALELQQRLTQAPKREILRQAGKELNAQARADLERAARAGQPIPAWLEEIITEEGRAHYARLYVSRPSTATGPTGGLPGFLDVPIATDVERVASTECTAAARKSPSGVPAQDALRGWKERLRTWAEQQGWRAVEVQGQVFGGDARAWQLGLSLWWDVAEIEQLATWVESFSQGG